ncbi:carboxymuconolactone decarboxylase family protein [Alkaliphilus transvaalensis]|uniref:hypothetical protein n=1 Tax=Alkaliphilus transvaalensis TaxID=114628 RepID=UPI00047DDB37|nr:hypothetical protein [Alkaliphilus transvaalensis]
MARIRPLERDEVNGKAQEIFDDFQKQRGNIPNMFRTLAYREELLETAHAHFNNVLFGGTVDIKLKEMLAVTVSQLNECSY